MYCFVPMCITVCMLCMYLYDVSVCTSVCMMLVRMCVCMNLCIIVYVGCVVCKLWCAFILRVSGVVLECLARPPIVVLVLCTFVCGLCT